MRTVWKMLKNFINKWDVVLEGIYGEDFNLEHFREAAIDSYKIILPELKIIPTKSIQTLLGY